MARLGFVMSHFWSQRLRRLNPGLAISTFTAISSSEMASAYLFHVVRNHPFFDGNKRVGTAAALTFLELNGVETKIPNQALVATVLAVAQGKIDKSALADFFREHAKS